jgi:hypothetical protein
VGQPQRGLYCHRANLDASAKNAYEDSISRHDVTDTTFMRS